MSLSFRVIKQASELVELAPKWQDLANTANAPWVAGPSWNLAWWQSYSHSLSAELLTFAGFEDDRLVALAPMYLRNVKGAPGLRVTELRLLGDAGIRPPAMDLLCVPGAEEEAAMALATAMMQHTNWDMVDWQPLRDPSRFRAHLASRMGSLGVGVDSNESGANVTIALSSTQHAVQDISGRVTEYPLDATSVRHAASVLRRLSRLEWGSGEETSPLADAETAGFLESIVPQMAAVRNVRFVRHDNDQQQAVAAMLVCDDNQDAMVLAMASDPAAPTGISELLAHEAQLAAGRGLKALQAVAPAHEILWPALPMSKNRTLRVRFYGHSRTASVSRAVNVLKRKVDSSRHVQGGAAAGARAAWARIRTAADTVAGYERYHLYRGELWTRGLALPEGVTMSWFGAQDYDALSESDQHSFLASLDLDIVYAREKWSRGDSSVLARIGSLPAGLAWSAKGQVTVTQIERALHLQSTEAYIHDVFVSPTARGRGVAPCILEFLSRELRQHDIYRSWALIGADNAPSMRAFQKAAYVAVADVLRARIPKEDRLVLRPPDPEARRLLGL